MIKFLLTVDADPDPAYPDTSLTVQSGDPRTLLVDDDLGLDFEKWYAAACDSNGVLYRVWEVQSRGSPPADTLGRYPVVIWWTGNDSLTTLTAGDQAALGQYLDAGNKLIVSGQSIAQQLAGNAFLRDRLRSEFVVGHTAKPYVVGVTGDPVTRGDTIVLGGGGGANNGTSVDGVRAVNGGSGAAFFRDYGDTTVHGIVRHKATDGAGMVFFAVPFEAINHSTSRYLQKWTLLRRILEWLGERVPGVAEELPAVADKRPYVLRVSPSPVSGRGQVEFTAPVTGRVELRTYALDGQLVAAQERAVTFGERARFELDARELPAGTYLLQLVTPDGVFAQKATVVR
jgi:hypothetical protein